MATTEATEEFTAAARVAAEAGEAGVKLPGTPASFALSVAGLTPPGDAFHPMDPGGTVKGAVDAQHGDIPVAEEYTDDSFGIEE